MVSDQLSVDSDVRRRGRDRPMLCELGTKASSPSLPVQALPAGCHTRQAAQLITPGPPVHAPSFGAGINSTLQFGRVADLPRR